MYIRKYTQPKRFSYSINFIFLRYVPIHQDIILMEWKTMLPNYIHMVGSRILL